MLTKHILTNTESQKDPVSQRIQHKTNVKYVQNTVTEELLTHIHVFSKQHLVRPSISNKPGHGIYCA